MRKAKSKGCEEKQTQLTLSNKKAGGAVVNLSRRKSGGGGHIVPSYDRDTMREMQPEQDSQLLGSASRFETNSIGRMKRKERFKPSNRKKDNTDILQGVLSGTSEGIST